MPARTPPLRLPRLLMLGMLTGALMIGPLLLYIAFGPADGNPIGLGLLAMLGVLVSGVLIVVGVVQWLLARGRADR
jgi:hypothetical protein